MRVERTWPPLGGSSVLRESIAPPADALERAERLVAAIGLDGYSEVEYRRSRDGRPLLMEVNPRLSQSVELAVRAGVDFPRMQLEWARGGRVATVDGYRTGVRLGWIAGEGRLLASAVRGGGPPPRPSRRAAVAGLADYARGARIEGLDVRDARPVVAALAFTARAVRRRGTRRRDASRG
jgi:hypothetical protein